MAGVFAVAWFTRYALYLDRPYTWRGHTVIMVLFLLLYFVMGRTYEAFQVSLKRISEMIYSQGLSIFVTDVVLYLVFCLLTREIVNPIPLILCFIIQMVLAILWCVIAHKWYFSVFPPARTVVIYDTREGMENLINESGLSKKFNVLDVRPVEECISGDFSYLDNMEAVFYCGIHSHDRNIILKECVRRGVRSYVIPRIGDTIMNGAYQMHLFHLPMLRVDRYSPVPEYLFFKRALDILLSGLALLITSPIILITSLCIKLEDHGPVFYKQCRLTKDGKRFNILKFRSMRTDAEKDGVARLSTGDNDDRITKVGRIIRKVRIDELPQLINILTGDMTIVGPRPERPEIAAEYQETLPEFELRLQAKAGLTGLAQVYGQYNSTPYDKLMMDLMYIAHPSFWEDLRIMVATVKILFLPDSTEGIEEGQRTAME